MCKYVCKYTYPVCLFYMTSCSLLKYLRGPSGGAGYTLGITVRKKSTYLYVFLIGLFITCMDFPNQKKTHLRTVDHKTSYLRFCMNLNYRIAIKQKLIAPCMCYGICSSVALNICNPSVLKTRFSLFSLSLVTDGHTTNIKYCVTSPLHFLITCA